MVVAFAAPGGDVLGPIPEPPPGAITARWGDSWLATTWEANTVWVRAADLGMNLANVAPAPQVQPQVIYQPVYAVPTPTEQRYAVTNEQPAAPAPQQMVILDRQQWALDAQRAGH